MSHPNRFDTILIRETYEGIKDIFLEQASQNNNYYAQHQNFIKSVQEELENYKKTGILRLIEWPGNESSEKKTSEEKENDEPKPSNSKTSQAKPKRGRTKKTSLLNNKAKISTSTTERESSVKEYQQPYVKLEKLSTDQLKQIKTESEEMPAPRQLPPRRKKATTTRGTITVKTEPRTTRSKARKATVKVETLSDEEETPTRNTRSTRKRRKIGRISDDQSVIIEEKKMEVIVLEETQSDCGSVQEAQSDYESATESHSDCGNTQTEMKKTSPSKSDEEKQEGNKTLTQDEVIAKTTVSGALNMDQTRTLSPTKKLANQVFSPYESSPVKKKVEAFEKLAAEKQLSSQPASKARKLRSNIPTNVKPAKNFGTPSAKPATPWVDYSVSQKSQSALKASQQEYRERDQRRREKENEALRKREAMLKAQIEEKKRKREEKELKVQQQKEQREREKLKILEAQKLKEEKYNKVIQEQEEKKQKLREEAERKRQLAKQRAMEEKKKEEERILEELRKNKEAKRLEMEEKKKAEKSKMEEEKRLDAIMTTLSKKDEKIPRSKPLYLLHPAPALPTDDCYDSDDEKASRTTKTKPYWTTSENLRKCQIEMISCGEKFKNTFFCPQPQSADLVEIFKIIDPKKLKRTSSAQWKKPPRYTLMPNMPTFVEEC